MIREEFQSRQETLERSHGHKFLTYCLRTWLGNDPISDQKEARQFYNKQAFIFLPWRNLSQTRYSIDKHRHSPLSRRAKRTVKKCDDGNIMQIVI